MLTGRGRQARGFLVHLHEVMTEEVKLEAGGRGGGGGGGGDITIVHNLYDYTPCSLCGMESTVHRSILLASSPGPTF